MGKNTGHKKLTPKQAAFVREYLIDLNASAAAKRAGYRLPSTPDGFYVYFLIDPRDNAIFYVGKGKGDRVYQHAKTAGTWVKQNEYKASRIRDIQDDGLSVKEVFFCNDMDEASAYSVERQLIIQLRDHGLTNIASGIISAEEQATLRARRLLDRLLSYEAWMTSMSIAKRDLVERVFGSCSEFYAEYKQAVSAIAMVGEDNGW